MDCRDGADYRPAMKLEINVNAPDSLGGGKAVVEKLLIEPVGGLVNRL